MATNQRIESRRDLQAPVSLAPYSARRERSRLATSPTTVGHHRVAAGAAGSTARLMDAEVSITSMSRLLWATWTACWPVRCSVSQNALGGNRGIQRRAGGLGAGGRTFRDVRHRRPD